MSTFQPLPNCEHNIQSKITSNRQTNQGKIYYGTSVGTFKQRYENQKKLFKYERHRTDTEHSNEF